MKIILFSTSSLRAVRLVKKNVLPPPPPAQAAHYRETEGSSEVAAEVHK